MRHQNSGRKLSRRKDHRKALLANLAVSLIKSGRIKTTDAKAKEVRPFVERMVTFAKRGDLHARRIVLSRIGDADAVKKLFEEIGPQYVNRPGGYTRIIKLGFRHGDNSPISFIEFVKEDEPKKSEPNRKSSKAKISKKDEVKVEEIKAEETAVEEIVKEETSEEVVEETAVAEETVTDEAVTEDAPVETAEEAAEEEKAEEAPAAAEPPEVEAGNGEESADEKEKSADDKAGEDK